MPPTPSRAARRREPPRPWSPDQQDGAEAFLRDWDPEIRRVSLAMSRDPVLADDIAQGVRLRLARAKAQGQAESPDYIPNLIRCAAIDACRVSGVFGRGGGQAKSGGTKRPTGPLLRLVQLDGHDEALFTPPMDVEAFGPERVVGEWICTLSSRQRRLATLLHIEGRTQKEVARLLGLSQQRVAQINADLLRLARRDLPGLLRRAA